MKKSSRFGGTTFTFDEEEEDEEEDEDVVPSTMTFGPTIVPPPAVAFDDPDHLVQSILQGLVGGQKRPTKKAKPAEGLAPTVAPVPTEAETEHDRKLKLRAARFQVPFAQPEVEVAKPPLVAEPPPAASSAASTCCPY